MIKPWPFGAVHSERPGRGALGLAAAVAQRALLSLEQSTKSAVSLVFTGEDHVSLIGCADVLPYFLERKPKTALRLKGLLTISYNGDSPPKIIQCFLDGNNHVLSDGDGHAIGRAIRFDAMAPDLSAMFDGKTTIILE